MIVDNLTTYENQFTQNASIIEVIGRLVATVNGCYYLQKSDTKLVSATKKMIVHTSEYKTEVLLQTVKNPDSGYIFLSWDQIFSPDIFRETLSSITENQRDKLSAFYDRYVSQDPVVIFLQNNREVRLSGADAAKFFRQFMPKNPIVWKHNSQTDKYECSTPELWIEFNRDLETWFESNPYTELWFFNLGNTRRSQRGTGGRRRKSK